MRQIHAEASSEINAPASIVYAILADYQHGHPAILPREYFPSLVVEAGGQGAGTKLKVTTRVMGAERTYQMLVSEPEPGKILAETDQLTGLVTTFTVTPLSDPARSLLRIATDWQATPGLAGLLEGWMAPPMMQRIYTRELQLINEYAARQTKA